MLEAREENKG
ncbi:hypothetical protein F383_21825 [Gossypium arboreum]|uniref:Uncharacterized protein n=1 Tax=Gossypium arboreum TaxID=29729 RepID=A0A0B0P3H6_GOSAR|nr:hypothetical protein F383_21825 [Gossypium arboreum]